jgi:hypothetical protein
MSQIHESLKQKDMQKAFRYLTEAQKQAVAMLPAAPAAGEKAAAVAAKEQKPAEAVPAKATTAAVATAPPSPQDAPSPFLFADTGEYLLICEKETKILYVFRFSDGRFSLVKQYPCIIGANNHGKTRGGDFATPEGVYFFLRFAPGKTLAENYGHGAFVLNYPNFLDRKERKDGGGI